MLKTMSLRWRMVLIVMILPLLFLVPVFSVAGTIYRQAYRDARLGKGQVITSQVAQIVETVSPYVRSIRDMPGLETYLRNSVNLQENKEIAFAALVSDKGLVYYHTLSGIAGTFAEGLTNLDEAPLLRRDVLPFRDVYLVTQKVAMPGAEGQSMYVVVAEYASAVDPPLIFLLPVGVGVLFVLFLVVVMQFFLQRLVLQPLDRLAEGAAIVGAGDLAYELEIPDVHEIGFLARSFNDMARRLEGMITTLEQQVAERTAE